MKKRITHSVFFSPTGTSRSITRAIQDGFDGFDGMEFDLTRSAPPPETSRFSSDELIIVGMPVYSGRLPRLAVECFQALEGNQTPAIAVVVYGNREYEDALLELSDLCDAQGFNVISAGAFIGEHSFSSSKFPLAKNRPDATDLQTAKQLGQQTRIRLHEHHSFQPIPIPGTRPYKPEKHPEGAATTTDPKTCIQCGACIAHCPTQSIRLENGTLKTNPDTCIWCMACTKHCPTGARIIATPKIDKIAQRLHRTCPNPKEPDLF